MISCSLPTSSSSGRKARPRRELHADRVKEICRYVERLDFLRFVATGEIHLIPRIGGDAVERLRLFLPVEIRRRRDRNIVDRGESTAFALDMLVEQRDVAVGVLEGNWMQQEGFRHAEDGGVRTDAQRQRDDAHQRHEPVLHQHPNAESHILPECLHRSSAKGRQECPSSLRASRRYQTTLLQEGFSH